MSYVITRNSENELYHFGVKGMKWGQRKVSYTTTDNGRPGFDKNKTSISSKYVKPIVKTNKSHKLTRKNVSNAINITKAGYRIVNEYGKKVNNKQANRYEAKAQRAATKGHKLRAMYYDHKSFKEHDKTYDDIENIKAAMKDISYKVAAASSSVEVGKAAVSRIVEEIAYKRDLKNRRIHNFGYL